MQEFNRMDMTLSPEQLAFRGDVRRFIDSFEITVPDLVKEGQRRAAATKDEKGGKDEKPPRKKDRPKAPDDPKRD